MKRRFVLLCFAFLALAMFAGGCGDDDSPTAPKKSAAVLDVSSILPPGASSGIDVTIGGSKFGANQGSGGVKVAGNDADVVSWSDNKIVFTMPAGLSEGQGATVTVITDAGKTTASQMDVTPPNTYAVTTHETMDQHPCWSAVDNYIYFSSTRDDNNWNIWLTTAIGGSPEQVTFDPASDFCPDINPSSHELAWSSSMSFSGANSEGDYEIFRGYIPCSPPLVCTTTMMTDNVSRDLYPSWATTVYAGYNMVYTWEEVDQSGHYLAWKVMLNGSSGPVELTEGQQPSFSPDGRWVVYSYHDDYTLADNIYKIPTDGGTPTQLTNYGYDTHPDWGGNDKIVFERNDVDTGKSADIYIMNSDGSGIQSLVSTYSDEHNPSWSNDGTKVVYYALASGRYSIYVYVMP